MIYECDRATLVKSLLLYYNLHVVVFGGGMSHNVCFFGDGIVV